MRESHSLNFTDSQGNTKNTFTDYHLIAKGKPSIDPPEVQTEYVEILGRNGLLDMTGGVDGKVYFKNMEATWNFIVDPRFDYYNVFHRLINEIHGRKMNIVLCDDDINATYVGRLAVGAPALGEHFNEISISANIDPNVRRTGENPEKPILDLGGSGSQDPIIPPDPPVEYEFVIRYVNSTPWIYFSVPSEIDAEIANRRLELLGLYLNSDNDGREVVPKIPYSEFTFYRTDEIWDNVDQKRWRCVPNEYDVRIYGNRNNFPGGIIKVLAR